MSLLSRAGDAIRNSPLMARSSKTANYSLANEDEEDPFVKGITFHAEYQGAEDLPASAGKGDQLCSSVIERVNRSTKPPFRKFSVLVTDKSIRLKDLNTKQVVDIIPIYNISFCGTSTTYDRAFSIIVKDSDSGKMRVHVMKAADRGKAQAMVLTVSKAFNIAFLAWQAKAKQQRRLDSAEERKGSDSPRVRRKIDELQQKKAAQEAAKPQEAPPAVKEVTQQMGAVSVTVPASGGDKEGDDDLEDAFTNLARARSHPDLLDTDVEADPQQFNWLEAKKHVDPGSTPNLLDI